MKIPKFTQKIKEEDGAVIVLVAAAMAVLMGMTALVVDVGNLVLVKNKLSNACDAAALAGARELPATSDAEAKALEYLQYNGVAPEEATITISDDNTKITVQASRQVNYTFARILGINSSTTSARAAAVFGSISSISGVVPFGIPDQHLVFGQEYQLKAGTHDDYGPGNYGALALEMPGASSYKNNLMYGYDGKIAVGDWIATEPGNMTGPTRDGIEYRINQCTHIPSCSVEHYHPDCPKIMIVPIYDPTSLNGRDEVKIVGFGSFLIKDVWGGGKYVSGYFLEMVPPEGLDYTVDPNQADYGLHAARLVD